MTDRINLNGEPTEDCAPPLREALTLLEAGRSSEAVPILKEALRLEPDAAEPRRALAEAHYACGDLADALECCVQAIEIDATYERAHYLSGVILAELGELDRSIASLERAISIRSDYADAIRALAAVLAKSKRYEQAIACYQKLVMMGVNDYEIMREYAETAEHHGDLKLATGIRKVIRKIRPDDAENEFNLASLTGEKAPDVAPVNLVVKTFDEYAETFESHLKGLGYCGPALLRDAVERVGLGSDLRILDLGCGTGLCGETFHSVAARLVGVDLSPGMLKKAERKTVYDRLHCGDVLEVLSEAEQYDLILAGDLLIYLGDLRPVFSMARTRVDIGGRFALTIEKGTDQDVAVNRGHRYQHSAEYVRSVSAESGWDVSLMEDCTLRQQHGEDVSGMVIVLTASSTGSPPR